MLTIDLEGRISTWNSGASKLFGRTEDEAIGQPLSALLVGDDGAAGAPETELATAERAGVAVGDRWYVRKDGSRFRASGVTTALRATNGQIRGFARILRDNTDRQGHELLEARAQHMEEEVTVRDAQVHRANDELRRVKEKRDAG